MNKTVRILASTLLIGSLIFYSNCGSSGDDPSPNDLFAEALSGGQISLQSATNNGVGISNGEFVGNASITLGALGSDNTGSFSSQNTTVVATGFPLFPASSTYSVSSVISDTNGTITIDGIDVNVQINNNDVILSFNLPSNLGIGGARESSVQGAWTVMGSF